MRAKNCSDGRSAQARPDEIPSTPHMAHEGEIQDGTEHWFESRLPCGSYHAECRTHDPGPCQAAGLTHYRRIIVPVVAGIYMRV